MRSVFSRRWQLAWLFVALAFTAAPATLPAKEPKERAPKIKDLTDMVLSNRITTKFAILLRYSELSSLLSSRGPLTVFVPSDSAFSRIPPETLAALERPENKETLQRIILFHIVNGQRLTAHDMAPLKTLLSCEGSPLPLRVNHAGYQIVSRAKILHADIHCLNGIMHEIDVVMLPPGVSLSALAPPPAVSVAPATNSDSGPASPSDTNAASFPLTNNVSPSVPANNVAPAPPDTNAASAPTPAR